jgi:uncharacterized repeat protein (TIGR03803 family)
LVGPSTYLGEKVKLKFKNLRILSYVALVGGCITLTTGCSGGPIAGVPAASHATQLNAAPLVTFKSLYSFGVSPDGAFPLASLTHLDGDLYGTTSQGGSANASGDGTVFKITRSGAEQILYSFQGVPDGQFPQASLIMLHGVFYGTTADGGTTGNGAVFTITPSGGEHIIYSFAGGSDGLAPTAGLIEVGGNLFGTTSGGGGTSCADGFGCGTVFKIDSTGNESVVYRFQGGSDGQLPAAGLIVVNNILFGTTIFGGGSGCNFKGCGTIFKLHLSGTESIVHSFQGGSDGANPSAGLIAVNDVLYGTTSSGGTKNDGTVFKSSRSGAESVLHSFKDGRADGSDPEAGLLEFNGTLYGTTFAGGANTLGTVYQITPSGTESLIHTFAGPSDGANPSASLVEVRGKLYGTTKTGGGANNGTVFSITP